MAEMGEDPEELGKQRRHPSGHQSSTDAHVWREAHQKTMGLNWP